MEMNIIKLNHRYDFGHDWYVQVLFTKRWALFQGSVSWNDFPAWPYIQIKSGNGSVLNQTELVGLLDQPLLDDRVAEY
jgi:hypothetical protein